MSEDWTDRLLKSWRAIRPGEQLDSYEVTARISRIAQHVAQRQEDVFGRFGLNRGEVGVLSALRIGAPASGLSPTQLFKGLMLSSAGITNRLDRLEERGLVKRTRHPSDRRGILVELTDSGRDCVDQAVGANTESEGELLVGLNPEERKHLTVLLRQLLSALE